MPKIKVTTPQKETEEKARELLEIAVLAVFEYPEHVVEEQLYAVQALADDWSDARKNPVYARELEKYLVDPWGYPHAFKVALGTVLLNAAKSQPGRYVKDLVSRAAIMGPQVRSSAPERAVSENPDEWWS